MLALLFSLLLTLYLIIPEAIFRMIFGWYVTPKNFVISTAETAYRALIVAIVPLGLAWAFSWYVPIVQTFPFPVRDGTIQSRRADYRLVTLALYNEEEYKSSKNEFWPALTRCARRQARLISWYIVLIALEAWFAGWLAANYARFRSFGLYNWLADKFLFSYISPWHPLLTPYLFVDKDTTVQVDILCTNDMLYQGTVSNHVVKEDGTLSGIFLRQPRRYNRELYMKDREALEREGKKPDKNAYWQPIPSENLYFFAEKIVNMNLNFKPPVGRIADHEAIRKLLIEVIGKTFSARNVSITQEKPESSTGSTQPHEKPPEPDGKV